jgi:hypothetical protein
MNPSEDRSAEKKSYLKPNLRVYGDVQLITQTTAKASANADGGKGNTKTS